MPPTLLDRLTEAVSHRYVVEGEVGRGGMSTVFVAHDTQIDRRVAIKVLSPELGAGVSPDRFLSEIRTAANLQHPHILPLFDWGETEGLLYYTMPFVEGITLKERIRDGPMPLEETLSILSEIGSGLGHAHKKGLVHRDVKPANVLISDGHALLADFGLARAIEQPEEALTQTGTLIGTTLYMSPEQASGTGELDQRSDLYSLACMAYEMLVGEPPFQASSNVALITAHLVADIPSVDEKRPDVPDEVTEAVYQAMRKDPADRFDTVEEFLSAAVGDSPLAPSGRASKKKPVIPFGWLSWAAGLVVTAVVAALVSLQLAPAGEGPGPESNVVSDRVVVAPFENRTGEENLGQVGRLAADMITEGLHRTGLVDVVPSLSAMRASEIVQELMVRSDTIVDPLRELALETSAGKVISGSYYRDGDELLFQTQITDAVTGRLLDALDPVRASSEAPSGAVDVLRDRVMGSLAVNLDSRLADVEIRQVPAPSFASYQRFDEGMQLYLDESWNRAAQAFRGSFEADTSFVLALHYAVLSTANIGSHALPVMDSLAHVLDERRSELAPYHRHWLDYMLARAVGRNAEAMAAIREAARLAPASKAVYNYAFASQLNHRPRQAVEALRTLDPERGPMRGWFPYWTLLADNLHRLGRHDEEVQAVRRALELHPDMLWAYLQAGEALAARGDVEEVYTVMEEMLLSPADDTSPAFVLLSVAREARFHGHDDAERRLLEEAIAYHQRLPPDDPEARRNRTVLVGVLHHLGRREEARELQRNLVAEDPDNLFLLGDLGILEAWLGNRAEAERISSLLEEAERDDPYSRGQYTIYRAQISGALGDGQSAGRLLETSFAQGHRPLRHATINLEPVADHPAVVRALTPEG